MIENSLLSVAEAAKLIGCSAANVRKLVRNKKLKSQRLHERAIAIDRASAEEYAKSEQQFGRPRQGFDAQTKF